MRKLAAVATLCALTVGCAVDGENAGGTDGAGPTNSMTTSSATADSSDNPWDLPLEQRPALFDPCAEIPDSALAEAGFTPEQKDPDINSHEPGSLMSCKWDNDEIMLAVYSSWKPAQEIHADQSIQINGPITIAGHTGILAVDTADEGKRIQRSLFFTSRGNVMVSVRFNTGLHTFRGEHFQPIRRVFDETVPPIVRHLPQGDFQ